MAAASRVSWPMHVLMSLALALAGSGLLRSWNPTPDGPGTGGAISDLVTPRLGGFGPPVTATAEGTDSQPACGSCHALPPPTGAHLRHTASAVSSPLECLQCHFTEDFDATHQNERVEVAFIPEDGTARATYGAEGCANLYCHSDGRGGFRPRPWSSQGITCASCHDDDTPEEIRLSGRHAYHLRIGVGCADCHGSVVDRRKAIFAPDLHLNGEVDVKVLGGDYAAGTCHPACHESRGW